MSDTESVVVNAAERIFTDLADAQTINADKNGSWEATLWSVLTEAGIPLAWVPESHGGSGVSLAEGFGVVNSAGRFGIAVPLVETLLAGWLLSQGGIAVPQGVMTVSPVNPTDRITLNDDGSLTGCARNVPFAKGAKHIAVLTHGAVGASIALLDVGECRILQGRNLADENRDTVIFDGIRPLDLKPAPAGIDQTSLMLMGGVVRSLQIAGALETILAISVAYANQRVAFEKKIAKFQAVQHNLAKLAGEVAAALAAANSAANAIVNATQFDDAVFLEALGAKIRCAEAAEKCTAIAHQVHGAIGFTSEHVLHRYTMRALAWRDDFGNESRWAVELGRRVAMRGADELWPLVTSC